MQNGNWAFFLEGLITIPCVLEIAVRNRSMMLLGISLNYLLIDAGMALIALVVGFVAALWYVDHKTGSHTEDQDHLELADQQAQAAYSCERASMAALQVRDLANNMASDVGEHNTLVQGISNELGALDSSSPQSEHAFAEAVAKMLSANEKLQDRLAEAEQKIQAQAAELQAQQSEARTDALTNLANRRAFDDAMEKSLQSFANDRKPFSLLLFDVDHFKQFNDTHGHQAGDEVLRAVGRTLAKTIKTADLPCRYGGEEFALIMPTTKIDSARLAAERIRKAIEEMTVEFEGKTLRVTASMGVASVAADDDTPKLIRRSDDAVYAAKKAGRNQTYWHNEYECLPIDATGEKPSDDSQTKPASAESSQQPVGLDSLPKQTEFVDELQRRVAESQRFGVSLSVLYLRVDQFDHLQQQYGDAVGTLLLESVAQFVRGTLRDMDLLGYLEQGDFVAMLPGSSEKEAQMVGSRVKTAISNCVIPLGGDKLRLDILHSVTDVYPDDDAEKMIERVAQLLSEQATQKAATV